VTSDPDFKVTILFDIEYLRNDTRSSRKSSIALTGVMQTIDEIEP